jgi:hypothetical protein
LVILLRIKKKFYARKNRFARSRRCYRRNQTKVRDLLGSFLFSGEDVTKKRKCFLEAKETDWRFVNYCFVLSIL